MIVKLRNEEFQRDRLRIEKTKRLRDEETQYSDILTF